MTISENHETHSLQPPRSKSPASGSLSKVVPLVIHREFWPSTGTMMMESTREHHYKKKNSNQHLEMKSDFFC